MKNHKDTPTKCATNDDKRKNKSSATSNFPAKSSKAPERTRMKDVSNHVTGSSSGTSKSQSKHVYVRKSYPISFPISSPSTPVFNLLHEKSVDKGVCGSKFDADIGHSPPEKPGMSEASFL